MSRFAVVLSLTIAMVIYGQGVRNLWDRAGVGHGVRSRQLMLFAGGMAAVIVALLTPLDALSHDLFAAHMVQHLLLIIIAPALIVLSRPLVPMLWGVPLEWRRITVKLKGLAWLANPVVAWILHATVMWIWHIPSLYESALRHEFVHALEHASFFGTAMLFWWSVFPNERMTGMPIFSVFTMGIQSSILGAFLTFASAAWYTLHDPNPYGLTLLQDQQLAGLIMWVPAGTVYTGIAAALFAVLLNSTSPESKHS
jgi:putative membrane protein